MILIRYLKYLFLITVAVVLVVLALANRGDVTLNLLPAELALWLGLDVSVELPLFLVILTGVVTGLLVGFVWEWLREHRHRAAAVNNRREAEKLKQEVSALRKPTRDERDEILALVDDTSPAR